MSQRYKHFTDQHLAFIRKHVLTMTNQQIGDVLGRSESSIAWQCAKMNIGRGKKRWTTSEIEELKRQAPGKTRRELAALFNVPENVLVAAMKNRKINNHRATQFKPGSVPFYKGKKLPKEFITEAMMANMFKAGHTPHNMGKDGDIVIRQMNEGPRHWIRISKMNWELLNRHNYKKFVAPIPEDYMVAFKDGNALNCEPSNLFLESKQQHMQRTTIARFPAEVREMIHLVAKVKRKMKTL